MGANFSTPTKAIRSFRTPFISTEWNARSAADFPASPAFDLRPSQRPIWSSHKLHSKVQREAHVCAEMQKVATGSSALSSFGSVDAPVSCPLASTPVVSLQNYWPACEPFVLRDRDLAQWLINQTLGKLPADGTSGGAEPAVGSPQRTNPAHAGRQLDELPYQTIGAASPFRVAWEFSYQTQRDWDARLDTWLTRRFTYGTQFDLQMLRVIAALAGWYGVQALFCTVYFKFSVVVRYQVLLTAATQAYYAGVLWGYGMKADTKAAEQNLGTPESAIICNVAVALVAFALLTATMAGYYDQWGYLCAQAACCHCWWRLISIQHGFRSGADAMLSSFLTTVRNKEALLDAIGSLRVLSGDLRLVQLAKAGVARTLAVLFQPASYGTKARIPFWLARHMALASAACFTANTIGMWRAKRLRQQGAERALYVEDLTHRFSFLALLQALPGPIGEIFMQESEVDAEDDGPSRDNTGEPLGQTLSLPKHSQHGGAWEAKTQNVPDR